MNDLGSGQPLDIVLAEDDADLATLNQRVLQAAGHQVEVAPDGGATLEAVRDTDPDLLILDIDMPRKNGIEVLEDLRAEPATADQAVVVLSSKQLTDAERHRLQRLKVIDLLAKWKVKPALLVGWVRGWAAGAGRLSRRSDRSHKGSTPDPSSQPRPPVR